MELWIVRETRMPVAAGVVSVAELEHEIAALMWILGNSLAVIVWSRWCRDFEHLEDEVDAGGRGV